MVDDEIDEVDDDLEMAECPLCGDMHAADEVPSEEDGQDEDGVMFPCSSRSFVYCDICGSWTDNFDRPRLIRIGWNSYRRFVCDIRRHGIACCDSCEAYFDEGDTRSPCYEAGTYCEECFNERGGCGCSECRPEGGGDYSAGGRNPEPQHVCRECHTTNVHVDLLTERFLCDCKARAMRKKDVLLRRPLLELVKA